MRFFPALLLIAAPLLAQEPTEEERRDEAERRIEKLAEEKRAYEKRAEELRRVAEERSKWGFSAEELKRLIAELRSTSDAKRAEAMEELKRVNATFDELLPVLVDALQAVEATRTNLEFGLKASDIQAKTLFLAPTVGVGGGAEAISGSADGTDYTLKSLGGGKYELNAKKHAGDGRLMEQWIDKGSLAELQGKYAFLKTGLAIQVAPDLKLRARAMLAPLHAPQAQLWWHAPANAQLDTWNGGGRVGVSVVAPSGDLRFHLQLPEGAGFIVQEVVPGSRAEEIGLRRMDILLRLDGELIDSPIQLKKLHDKAGVLEIVRRSEARKIDLATIVEAKPRDQVLEDKLPAETPPDAPAGAR